MGLQWDKPSTNWCRISSIHSMFPIKLPDSTGAPQRQSRSPPVRMSVPDPSLDVEVHGPWKGADVVVIRWVEEILHHLGWLKPYK